MVERLLYPIPDTLDYAAAFAMCEEEQINKGGIRGFVHQEELNAKYGHRVSAFYHVSETGAIALSLEPKNKRGVAVDQSLAITHAFKRGMLAGFMVTQMMYDGSISPRTIRQSLIGGIELMTTDGERSLFREPPLLEWGVQGVNMVGEASEVIMDRWSERLSTTYSIQRLVKLGTGAVIATSHALIMNEHMNQIQSVVERTNWNEELTDLIQSDTSES